MFILTKVLSRKQQHYKPDDFVFLFFIWHRDKVRFGLRLSHSDLTTEEVVSGIIEWPLPPVLLLHSCNKESNSVDVLVDNTTDMVTIKVKWRGGVSK